MPCHGCIQAVRQHGNQTQPSVHSKPRPLTWKALVHELFPHSKAWVLGSDKRLGPDPIESGEWIYCTKMC